MKYQVPDLNYYHLTKKEFEAKCNRNVRETIRFSVIQTLTSDLVSYIHLEGGRYLAEIYFFQYR